MRSAGRIFMVLSALALIAGVTYGLAAKEPAVVVATGHGRRGGPVPHRAEVPGRDHGHRGRHLPDRGGGVVHPGRTPPRRASRGRTRSSLAPTARSAGGPPPTRSRP